VQDLQQRQNRQLEIEKRQAEEISNLVDAMSLESQNDRNVETFARTQDAVKTLGESYLRMNTAPVHVSLLADCTVRRQPRSVRRNIGVPASSHQQNGC
jgi:hypothetical protein